MACGEAHALCLTSLGKVYAWGQNSCGQVGNGPTPSGFLRDAMDPVHIICHGANTDSGTVADRAYSSSSISSIRNDTGRGKRVLSVKLMDICCGTFHSVVKDVHQGVWSWGARGDVCLGHNDPLLTGSWASRVSSVFSASSNNSKILVPFELVDWCTKWATPRRIKALTVTNTNVDKEEIVQLTAGDMHTGFLYSSGRFYLCGSGPVVPPIVVRAVDEEEDDNEDNPEGEEGNPSKQEEIDAAIKELHDRMVSVSTPRCPSAMWLFKASTRVTKFVCSAGE